MNDAFHVDLRDAELEEEIRLVSELMILASEAPTPLDQGTIDSLLGIPHPRQAAAPLSP